MVSQALQSDGKRESVRSKSRAVAKIAESYAKAGKYEQALQIAKEIKEIKDVYPKSLASAKIAGIYAENDRTPNVEEKKIFHEIINVLE